MLKEFDRIAKGMLFMHGHVVRPDDIAEEQDARVENPPPTARRRHPLGKVTAVCIATLPARLIAAQIR